MDSKKLPKEHGKNRYGLDMSYFRNLINRELNIPLTNHRPDELARVFARAARTADEEVLRELEFCDQSLTEDLAKLRIQLSQYKAEVERFSDMLARIQEQSLDFQSRVRPWLLECFGEMIAGDREERNHRFLEEALELVQSCGCSQSEAHQLVDYVFGRDVGEPSQEVGGVMVTLAALCLANGLDMHANGETELVRIWGKVEQIRAKQAGKPKHSPFPAQIDKPMLAKGG